MTVTQQFAKGQMIIVEGTQGDRTYRIKSGEVLICKQNASSRPLPLAKLGPGDIFGEMFLLDGEGVRSASVIAASDVVVEVIFAEELEEELKALNPNMKMMLNSLSERVRNTSDQYVASIKPSGDPPSSSRGWLRPGQG